MTSKERYIQQLTQDLYCRNTDTPDECNDMAEIIADEVYGKIEQALNGFLDVLLEKSFSPSDDVISINILKQKNY